MHVLETSLRLIHPFIPFITEEIWQRIREHRPEGTPDSIMIAPYPTADTGAIDADAEQEMESIVFDPIRNTRNERAESKVPPGKIIDVTIVADVARAKVEAHAPTISALAKVQPNIVSPSGIPSKEQFGEAKVIVLKDMEIIIPLEGMIDRDEEKSRLLKEIEAGKSEITRIESLLANESFISKAPDSVVEKERRKLTERKDTVTRLEKRLAGLG
ncbi:MAG: class I tRNA ligase family protein [Dehalococcoidia bacterium]|nr:MAG: class I tRNA ligase family protein [Dehalococcoidia bacterium]